jgi:hypothetical protein
MHHDAHDDHDHLAERTTRLLSHLDGALDATMLDAMQGAWSMLERSATTSDSHARAVRARMLWESMGPAAHLAPSTLVSGLVATWDDEVDEELADDGLADAA